MYGCLELRRDLFSSPDAGGQRGFAMVELLFALLIFSVAMMGLWSGQMAGKRAGYDALQRTVATNLARDILETGVHVETADSYPTAAELLQLGAVWLLNETLYAAGQNAHARRLSPKDEDVTPDWKDMTLRVHYVPDRFFVAHEVDWSKYCKGLLLDNCTSAVIGGERALVPMDKLPDGKDGVIVYEVRYLV